MKKILGFMVMAATVLLTAGCDNGGESIVPAEISNLKAIPQQGAIMLKWDNPAEGDFFYAQVQYTDPATETLKKVNVSSYTNECLIEGLLRKYGNYAFKVYSVSTTNTFSSSPVEIEARPEAAPPTFVENASEKVALTVAMLSSNASDPSEGDLANLIDGNTGTFWHSNWHTNVPKPHYIQIDLGEEQVEGVKFKTVNRNATGYAIGDVTILGSNDGDEWVELGKITTGFYTNVKLDEKETDVFSVYPKTQEKFSKIRFNVTSTPESYWCLSEFELWEVSYTVIDPEE